MRPQLCRDGDHGCLGANPRAHQIALLHRRHGASVERLAERSTDATKKIATLIKTIQSETNEAVGSMEKSIHEVVEGSKLANSAGKALEEIGSVSTTANYPNSGPLWVTGGR